MLFPASERFSRLQLFSILGASICASGFLAHAALSSPKFFVEFLDTGEGSAALVWFSKRDAVLINAGPDASIVRELGRKLPYTTRSLALLVALDTSAKSIGGAPEVFRRYRVSKTLRPEQIRDTKTAELFLRLTEEEEGSEVFVGAAGQRFLFSEGSLEVLSLSGETLRIRITTPQGAEFLFPDGFI